MNSFLAGVCVGSFIAYVSISLMLQEWIFLFIVFGVYAMIAYAASVDYIIRRYYEEMAE